MLFVVMNPISTAVFFAGSIGDSSPETQRSVALKSVLVAVLLLTFLLLLMSPKVAKLLGKQGNEILTRILGILLCSLSVEMIIGGLSLAGFLPQ